VRLREKTEDITAVLLYVVSLHFAGYRKEGLAVRGGRSPNWVNHVYLCLSCFVHFLCLYFCNILCVPLLRNI